MEIVTPDTFLFIAILDNVFHTTLYQLSLITSRSQHGCHFISLLFVKKTTLITKVYFCNMLNIFMDMSVVAIVVSIDRRQQKG